MKATKLSPLELSRKKARDQLRYLANRLKGAYSFGHIKCFKDILLNYGLSEKEISAKGYFASELNMPVKLSDINEYISDNNVSLETSIWLEDNPPIRSQDNESQHETPNQSLVISSTSIEPSHETSRNGTKELPYSEKEKAFLYWFQKKAIVELLESTDL